MERDHLTIEDIESVIVGEQWFYTTKTTICILTLKNGFEVVGTSGVVNPERFDLQIGKGIARKRAVDQVWLVEGYRLQCALYKEM